MSLSHKMLGFDYSPMPKVERRFIKTAVEIKAWTCSYIPHESVTVLIHSCPNFSVSKMSLRWKRWRGITYTISAMINHISGNVLSTIMTAADMYHNFLRRYVNGTKVIKASLPAQAKMWWGIPRSLRIKILCDVYWLGMICASVWRIVFPHFSQRN